MYGATFAMLALALVCAHAKLSFEGSRGEENCVRRVMRREQLAPRGESQ